MNTINSNDKSILKKDKLQELTKQIDPRHTLDADVEEVGTSMMMMLKYDF